MKSSLTPAVAEPGVSEKFTVRSASVVPNRLPNTRSSGTVPPTPLSPSKDSARENSIRARVSTAWVKVPASLSLPARSVATLTGTVAVMSSLEPAGGVTTSVKTVSPSAPVNAPAVPPDSPTLPAVNPLTGSLKVNVRTKSPAASTVVSLVMTTVGATVSTA